jgi:hypothetical protein
MLAANLVTIDLRREVLVEKAAELEETLANMRRRQKELNRKLLGIR